MVQSTEAVKSGSKDRRAPDCRTFVTLACCFLNEQRYYGKDVTSRIMGWEPRKVQTEAIENILVVDDEEAIREVVSTMLESKGYRCTAVSNGRAAQDQVKRTTPDLGLSEMIMTEMYGIKLLECLPLYNT